MEVYILIFLMVQILFGTRGIVSGGEIPNRYVRIGGSSVAIYMSPGTDLQTNRARNTQPHDNVR